MECPARLVLYADLKSSSLVIREFHREHNHATDEASFRWYPKNRRLSTEEKAAVISLHKLYVRATDIRSTVEKSSGKSLLTKDVHNICAGRVLVALILILLVVCSGLTL